MEVYIHKIEDIQMYLPIYNTEMRFYALGTYFAIYTD